VSIYQLISLGQNLSAILASFESQHDAMRSIERGTTEPVILVPGLLWNRTNHPTLGDAIMRYDGTSFVLYADPAAAQINDAGTVPFASDQPMGGNIFIALGDGAADGESVHAGQVILTSSGEVIDDIDMGGNRLTGLGAPVGDNDAVRKVDLEDSAKFANVDPAVFEISGDAGSFNDLGFVPDLLHVSCVCSLRNPGGGAYINAANFNVDFWRIPNAGPIAVVDSNDPSGAVHSDTITGQDYHLEVTFKHTEPQGVYLAFRKGLVGGSGAYLEPRKVNNNSDPAYHLFLRAIAFSSS